MSLWTVRDNAPKAKTNLLITAGYPAGRVEKNTALRQLLVDRLSDEYARKLPAHRRDRLRLFVETTVGHAVADTDATVGRQVVDACDLLVGAWAHDEAERPRTPPADLHSVLASATAVRARRAAEKVKEARRARAGLLAHAAATGMSETPSLGRLRAELREAARLHVARARAGGQGEGEGGRGQQDREHGDIWAPSPPPRPYPPPLPRPALHSSALAGAQLEGALRQAESAAAGAAARLAEALAAVRAASLALEAASIATSRLEGRAGQGAESGVASALTAAIRGAREGEDRAYLRKVTAEAGAEGARLDVLRSKERLALMRGIVKGGVGGGGARPPREPLGFMPHPRPHPHVDADGDGTRARVAAMHAELEGVGQRHAQEWVGGEGKHTLQVGSRRGSEASAAFVEREEGRAAHEAAIRAATARVASSARPSWGGVVAAAPPVAPYRPARAGRRMGQDSAAIWAALSGEAAPAPRGWSVLPVVESADALAAGEEWEPPHPSPSLRDGWEQQQQQEEEEEEEGRDYSEEEGEEQEAVRHPPPPPRLSSRAIAVPLGSVPPSALPRPPVVPPTVAAAIAKAREAAAKVREAGAPGTVHRPLPSAITVARRRAGGLAAPAGEGLALLPPVPTSVSRAGALGAQLADAPPRRKGAIRPPPALTGLAALLAGVGKLEKAAARAAAVAHAARVTGSGGLTRLRKTHMVPAGPAAWAAPPTKSRYSFGGPKETAKEARH
jgi:hypothetical protein